MYIEECIEKNKELFEKKYGDIIVPTRLVNKGEKMTVRLESYMGDNVAFAVTHNSFCEDSMPIGMCLDLFEEDGKTVAEVELEFHTAGNTKLELWCGTHRIMRQIAVLDKGYAAVIPWIGYNIPIVDEEIHKYDLPGDYWTSVNLSDKWDDKKIADLAKIVQGTYKYGDRAALLFDARSIDENAPTETVFELPREVQEKGITRLYKALQQAGIEKLELFACYTPDGVTMDIFEKLGAKALTSLCVWQNWRDGNEDGWKINHHGVPNQPYYPAADDFRKNGGKRDIMCFTMGNSSCDRNYDIMAYSGCPTNSAPGHRYRAYRIEHFQVGRFYDAFDGFISAAKHSQDLLTVTVAIESFSGKSDWNACNEMAIRYMVKKAAKEKIVFVSAADIADYHKKHDMPMQKAYFFQPDVYFGIRDAELPGHVADRLEADTPEYLAVIKRGSLRPMFFFDYTEKWDSGNYSDKGRNKYRLINPDKIDPNECEPKQVESRDVRYFSRWEGNTLIVCADSDTPKRRMVTGVFDIPYAKDFSFTVDKCDASATKIYDYRNDNTHLFIDMGALKAGMNEVRITVKGTPRTPDRHSLIYGYLEVMPYRDHAYLRSIATGSGIRVRMDAPEGAYVVHCGGEIVRSVNGKLTFEVNTDLLHEAPIIYGITPGEFDTANICTETLKRSECRTLWK